MTTPRYASVVLDVDSTVSGVEGIDWLGRLRGRSIGDAIARLTADAMRGAIPLEEIYGRRLAIIRPTRAEIDTLARAYLAAIAPDCATTISELRSAGVRLELVSGGIRLAILPMAGELGFDPNHVHAVDVAFDAAGNYLNFDASSPLTTSSGKATIVASIGLPRPILAVGDGTTDIPMRMAADSFAAFTGFVARDAVVHRADFVIESFRVLKTVVLGDQRDGLG